MLSVLDGPLVRKCLLVLVSQLDTVRGSVRLVVFRQVWVSVCGVDLFELAEHVVVAAFDEADGVYGEALLIVGQIQSIFNSKFLLMLGCPHCVARGI